MGWEGEEGGGEDGGNSYVESTIFLQMQIIVDKEAG